MAWEYALTILRPSAVRRQLMGKILERFEQKNLMLVDMQVVRADRALIEATYPEKRDDPDFDFEALVRLMTSGPSVAALWAGEQANETTRQVIGLKDPLKSPAGTIRGDFSNDFVDTVVHGSRSAAEGWREAKLWFPDRFEGDPPPEPEQKVEEEKKALSLAASPGTRDYDLGELTILMSYAWEPAE